MNETQSNQPQQSGSKLSTIFLVVLGLHIVLIVAFSAYHLLKGDTSIESAAPAVAEEAETAPAAENEVGALHSNPVVETEQDIHAARPAPAVDPTALPMPASSDPIWTRVPAPEEVRSVEPSVPAPSVVRVPTPQVPSSAQSGSHTVSKGDTLAKIARVHGIKVAELKAANSLNSDIIRIGQVLVVPGTTTNVATVTPVTPAPVRAPAVVPAASASGTHTVGKGDTLWGIARKYGVNAKELATLNGLTDPSKLKIGMILKVPGSSARQEMATPVPARPAPVPVQNTDMAMAPAQN
jgi:LysM repeat protein